MRSVASMRRTVLLAVIAAFLLPAATAASPSVRDGVQDDAWLQYGPGTFDGRLEQLQSLGVDVVRVTIDWRVTQRAASSHRSRPDLLLGGLQDRRHCSPCNAVRIARGGQRRLA